MEREVTAVSTDFRASRLITEAATSMYMALKTPDVDGYLLHQGITGHAFLSQETGNSLYRGLCH